MTYSTQINFKKIYASIGVFAVVALIAFGTSLSIANAQYDDYSVPSYGSDYSVPSYGSDYSSSNYTSNYSTPSYTSDYNVPTYSSNYSASNYNSDYNVPTYSSNYNVGSYNSDYSVPTYASDYNVPTYSSNYNVPTYTSDYNVPTYTSDYNVPTYTSDYNVPTYTSDYNVPTYTSDYNVPTYTSNYSVPTYGSTYSPSYSSVASTYTGGYGYTGGVYIGGGYGYTGGGYVVPPVQNIQSLSGSCIANTSNVNVGSTVTWSISGVSGGVGGYSYAWSGTDGLSGSGSSISKSYSYAGTKSATVTIRSGNQSISRNCTTYINTPYVPPTPTYNNLTAYCSVNQSSVYTGTNVNWSASASGGNGYYTYSWSGTDGLYGTGAYASMSYYNPGTKYAYVTVTSGGQSMTATCSTYINSNYVNPPVVTYVNPQPPIYPIYQNPYARAMNRISLSQVPYTGLDSHTKLILFTLALIAWSAAVTYVVVIRKKAHNNLATVSVASDVSDVNNSELFQNVSAPRTGVNVYWPTLGGGNTA